MGRRKDALEKIHEARLQLIETITEGLCSAGQGESLKAQAEALDILKYQMKSSNSIINY